MHDKIVGKKLVLTSLITIFVAVVINTLVYWIATTLGAFPDDLIIEMAKAPMTLPPVIVSTIVGMLGGILVFWVFSFIFRRTFVKVFRIVAVIVLLLSFVTPFSVPDATVAFIIALNVMHIVAGILVIIFIPSHSIQEVK
ncbi:DUF6069 family protein [Ectobacillus sp. JY-23]|uniref:DUF6069 family protein n=1 Tax=Ectobacillus sp. JY-23 TaxID=2933872 RepID=UPI001FF53358|nr:DUF6069 family protein [Ectobacillus sp. JY-23]UOY92429.1 DUF6069 family protein [Ectobacillus sp. JY-23]